MTSRIELPPALRSRPFTPSDAREAGIGPNRLRSADIQHPFRGVSVASGEPLTSAERCRALQVALPEAARFMGPTAASIMRVPLPRRLDPAPTLHVAVPAPQRAPSRRGVTGHQVAARAGDIRIWNGLRISDPARAWCELAPFLALVELVAAGDFLIHHDLPICTRIQLEEAVASHPGRRGRPLLREAIDLVDERSESPKESELRVILVRSGIGGLVVNLPIRTADGYSYRADLAFAEQRVIVEYQSDFHRDPELFRRDMTRRSRLEADGWFVVEVNQGDLGNPAELVRRLRRVLALRGGG